VRRFRFNLEKLLELRAFHERKAEMVLAEKAGRCALLDSELREVAKAKSRTGRDMFGRGRDIEDSRAAQLYLVRLERDRDALIKDLALAETEREGAREAYVERRKSRESIEKIKERRQAEYYRLAEREETKALDDLARRKVIESADLRSPPKRREAEAEG
jgi:flagellar protein FliJ